MIWLQALSRLIRQNNPCVVILVAEVEGSAPRPAGTRMVVTDSEIYATIGGGALELEAITHARTLLLGEQQAPAVSVRQFPLGKALSQCCGGRVTLQFECYRGSDFNVHVFGAGHVAQEFSRIVSRINCRAIFHDSRNDWLEKLQHQTRQSAHCMVTGGDTSLDLGNEGVVHTRLLGADTFSVVEECEKGAYFLVMTHSHDLDFDVVEAVLSRGDSRYCGLIASPGKARSFRNRLSRKGFTETELQQLTAPLGETVQTGNAPVEVAVAAMSDVLTRRQKQLSTETRAT
ncbi:MAG: xanthine dehydrogenase accessory protein XdhC [Granulosicoccus sp.]